MSRKLGIILLGVSLLMPASLWAAVGPGSTAPDFLVEDLNGEGGISLSQHQGKVIVLVFFYTQ